MAVPLLGLPQRKRGKALQALIEVLMDDPDLRDVVRTWRIFEGEPTDFEPPKIGELPWIRITAQPLPQNWEAVGLHDAPFHVLVETAIAGTRQQDAIALYEAIEYAIFQPDQPPEASAVKNKLSAAGIVIPTMTLPSFQIMPLQEDYDALFGRALIKLEVMVPT